MRKKIESICSACSCCFVQSISLTKFIPIKLHSFSMHNWQNKYSKLQFYAERFLSNKNKLWVSAMHAHIILSFQMWNCGNGNGSVRIESRISSGYDCVVYLCWMWVGINFISIAGNHLMQRHKIIIIIRTSNENQESVNSFKLNFEKLWSASDDQPKGNNNNKQQFEQYNIRHIAHF